MPQETPTTPEKRRSPRLCCVGSAELFIAPDVAPLKARILDLSTSGCRLMLLERVRLDTDWMVEVKFTVNQLPFRVVGQVKGARSPKEIGILFPALSARVRLQVEDLVKELMTENCKPKPVSGEVSPARSSRLA